MCCSLICDAACLTCNLCCCLGKAFSANRKEQVRSSYITLMLIFMGILFLFQEYFNSWLDALSSIISCPGEAG